METTIAPSVPIGHVLSVNAPVPRPEPPEVAALIADSARGDRDAQAHLHARYAPMVHGILLSRVPAGEVADLLQDVFVKVLEQLGQVRDPDHLGAWIATIARNVANDFHRRRPRTETLPAELPRAAPPTLEARECLEAIRSLPEAYRESLALRLIEGLTGPEIAARLGLTPGSVRVNLHRGMKRLRSRLGLDAPAEEELR